MGRARHAARSGRWADAVVAYRRHLTQDPANAAVWVQLGHVLKEAGDLTGAAGAYRQATVLHPETGDSWIHLAYLERRMGRRDEALRVLEQAIVNGAGDATQAAQGLIDMGARDRLPLRIQQRIEADSGDYALTRYGVWRASRMAGVAHLPDGTSILAVIDARGASDELVEVTRSGLGGVVCLIVEADDEVCLFIRDAIGMALPGVTHVLLVAAGTRLDPDAVVRLHAALQTTGAAASYGDHDHWVLSGEDIVFADPCLQPMSDPVWFRRSEVWPPCLLVTAEAAIAMNTWYRLFADRMALPVSYAHVPLMLASRPAGTMTGYDAAPQSTYSAEAKELIQVIIQTRDAPAMLAGCVDRLRATAAHPDCLDIVIIDNRSVMPETVELLRGWSDHGIARVIRHDQPFNWARANNLAVQRGDAPLLLFLNNDVEMESAGWDLALREGLAREGIGALGALLLYPDRLIQHAGVVFGMGDGGPVHEGVGHPVEPGGPAERWRHPRLAAAVTGAWLATTRVLFDAVGGFEERLPIAYNDIDFCLRCREAGQSVMQASEIVAVHRESATRGSVMSPEEQARDQKDWEWMRARWGAALEIDPAYHPAWSRAGQPFDGLCQVAEETVACWTAASARTRPWCVSQALISGSALAP